ncbi:MAG TPA: efflux RND transporter periplasmic adaptor subunit [Gammaproteobacteria bacterium]|nr:efflux RND transporter periplasmic adaptor subunit [Gammaproteobacteria bacterium]
MKTTTRSRSAPGLLLAALVLPGLLSGPARAEEDHEAETVRLTLDSLRPQGVATARVESRQLSEMTEAPGEVRLDAYRTAQVTPRIAAQVVARHARLGERVRRHQPLVTLSSVAMADAQGALIEAEREWQRVRKLGRKVVSEKRYIAAQVARQRAFATVSAYGMTDAQIRKLLAGDPARANGSFDLLSPLDGTIIADSFVLGEVIEPGRVLFEISDESRLWVEARLRPETARRVRDDQPARIGLAEDVWLPGRIVQRHKRLDEASRTLAIRIAVDNAQDRLHPGQFVTALLPVSEPRTGLAVPREAVVLMDGAPTVFRLEGGELHPRPVETGPTLAGWTEIRAGLEAGDTIAVRGVFLLKSLLLKSRIGEDAH